MRGSNAVVPACANARTPTQPRSAPPERTCSSSVCSTSASLPQHSWRNSAVSAPPERSARASANQPVAGSRPEPPSMWATRSTRVASVGRVVGVEVLAPAVAGAAWVVAAVASSSPAQAVAANAATVRVAASARRAGRMVVVRGVWFMPADGARGGLYERSTPTRFALRGLYQALDTRCAPVVRNAPGGRRRRGGRVGTAQAARCPGDPGARRRRVVPADALIDAVWGETRRARRPTRSRSTCPSCARRSPRSPPFGSKPPDRATGSTRPPDGSTSPSSSGSSNSAWRPTTSPRSSRRWRCGAPSPWTSSATRRGPGRTSSA